LNGDHARKEGEIQVGGEWVALLVTGPRGVEFLKKRSIRSKEKKKKSVKKGPSKTGQKGTWGNRGGGKEGLGTNNNPGKGNKIACGGKCGGDRRHMNGKKPKHVKRAEEGEKKWSRLGGPRKRTGKCINANKPAKGSSRNSETWARQRGPHSGGTSRGGEKPNERWDQAPGWVLKSEGRKLYARGGMLREKGGQKMQLRGKERQGIRGVKRKKKVLPT